jgi:uncharacterized caspase-like protein
MARYALLISADTYEDGTLARLRAPAVDAEALEGALADPAIGGFQVRRLHNRPSHEVAMEIEELFAERGRDDLILLYFSCHGIKDDGGSLYFATTNTRHRRLRATSIPASFVSDLMEASASRRVVLLLDCCFSGAFARGLSPRAGGSVDLDRLAGRGTAIITASTAMEYAFEFGGPAQRVGGQRPSLFTGALVEGLATGGADLDADGPGARPSASSPGAPASSASCRPPGRGRPPRGRRPGTSRPGARGRRTASGRAERPGARSRPATLPRLP